MDIVLLYKLNTSGLFSIPSSMEEEKDLDMDEEWPPFRKVRYKTCLIRSANW